MDSKEVYFLNFLEDINPIAAQNARKMEELLFEDSSSAIVKSRVFAEEILNEVFKQEQIETPYLPTLFEKVAYLSKEGYIKKEIQQSFDTIRSIGNKAAHDGEFNDILEAFKIHKEMYKIGVWFYEVYSLEQLKVPLYEAPKPRKKENLEDIVKKQLLELFGSHTFESELKNQLNNGDERKKDINTKGKIHQTTILKKDESYLLQELSRLKDSSQEAIENVKKFSAFKDYLHVDRVIQVEFEEVLSRNKDRNKGNLILLCGSVGDGKSHLLAYLNEKKKDLIRDYIIFNDATESFSPNKNAMETLEEVLSSFSDQNIQGSDKKVILAINMGVLHNFINTDHKKYSYNLLKQFINQSGLFSQNITTYYNDDYFDLLSFGDHHSYELTEEGPKSFFYSALLEKVFAFSDENPFYLALLEDEKNQVNTMVHENYKFLQNNYVQEQVVQLVIHTIVQKKLVISARAFLNFIADILIPYEIKDKQVLTSFDVLESSMPNLLFNSQERSPILGAISKLDPIHLRSKDVDHLIIKLNTLSDWDTIINESVKDNISKKWFNPFKSRDDLTDYSFNLFFETLIRITFLTNKVFADKVVDQSYLKYLQNLYYFNTGNQKGIKGFYDEIKTAIFNWKGSPKKDYIYLTKPSENYCLSQKLNLKPSIEHLKSSTKKILDSFKSSIVLSYHGGDSENKVFLEIDYPLYTLLMKVQEGYRPNKKDEEDAIKFDEFIKKSMTFGEKKNEVLIYFPKDDRFYIIKRDDFGTIVFERE